VYVFLIGSLFKRADQFAFDLLDRRSHMNFFFINIYGSPLILFNILVNFYPCFKYFIVYKQK
jgi:hypothetical protein